MCCCVLSIGSVVWVCLCKVSSWCCCSLLERLVVSWCLFSVRFVLSRLIDWCCIFVCCVRV